MSGPEFIGDVIYKTEYDGPWPNTDNFYDHEIRTMVEVFTQKIWKYTIAKCYNELRSKNFNLVINIYQ